MKRLTLLIALLAFSASAHDIPDGKTPQEKCLVSCEREHCQDVLTSRCYEDDTGAACDRIHAKRDRCKRSCAVSTIGGRRAQR